MKSKKAIDRNRRRSINIKVTLRRRKINNLENSTSKKSLIKDVITNVNTASS